MDQELKEVPRLRYRDKNEDSSAVNHHCKEMDGRTYEKSQDVGRNMLPLREVSSSFHTEEAGPHV